MPKYPFSVRYVLPFLGAMLVLSVAANAQDHGVRCALKDIVPSITTTGTASAEVVPNLALISLGVVTERPKAADAARDNATASQAIVAEIKAQGIDPRDIKTLAVSLAPVYDEIRGQDAARSKRILRGYVAHNAIDIRLRQIDKAGAFVARWIETGANRVESITFDVDQKEVKLEALRIDAVRDALRKATAYATGLSIRLGRVLSIAQPSFEARPAAPLQMARATAPDATTAIALEPGVETLQTAVVVTWELVQ